MLIRFLLPTLLFALLCNSSLKASSVSTEADFEEETNPLMMMEWEKAGPHEKDSPEENHNSNRKNSNVNSSQPRENISELQKNISDAPNQKFNLDKSNKEEAGETNDIWKELPGMENQNALQLFIDQAKNTRADNLFKKKLEYEEEFASLDSNPEQARIIRGLIALCNQASEYHYQLINRLIPEGTVSFFDPKEGTLDRMATLKASVLLERLSNINSRPNEVERLIEEIEKNYQELVNSQKMHAAIKRKITTLQDQAANQAGHQNENLPGDIETLNIARRNMESCINRYHQLIASKIDFANRIKLPYELTDEDKIQNDSENDSELVNIIKAEALAKHDYFLSKLEISSIDDGMFRYFKNILKNASTEANKEKPQKEAINLFFQAVDLYLQTLIVLDVNHSLSETEVNLIRGKITPLCCMAQELQREDQRQMVIEHISEALKYFDQAIATLENETDPDKITHAKKISDIAYMLNNIIRVEQKDNQEQVVINMLIQALDFHKKALTALENENDPDRTKKMEYWSNAGEAGYKSARPKTTQKIKYSTLEALSYFEQAVAALDNKDDDRIDRAEYLNNIGKAILDANYRDMEFYTHSCLLFGDVRHSANALRCFKKALTVLNNETNPNRIQCSKYLNNAGKSYLEAAKQSESLFLQETTTTISPLLEEAQLWEKRYQDISGDTSCTIS